MWQRAGWMAVLACWTILVPGPSSGHVLSGGIVDSLKMSGQNVSTGAQNIRQKSVLLRKLRYHPSGSNWTRNGADAESSESTDSNLTGIKSVESFKGRRTESQHFPFHGRESGGSVGWSVNTTNGRTLTENSERRSRRKVLGGDSRRTRNMTSGDKNGGNFNDEFQTFLPKATSLGEETDDPSGSTRVALRGDEISAAMEPERPTTTSDSRVDTFNDEESEEITFQGHESLTRQNLSTKSEKAKVAPSCEFETGECSIANAISSPDTLFNTSVEVATKKTEIHGLETSYNGTRGPRVSAARSMDNEVVPAAGKLARSSENYSDEFVMKYSSRKRVRESAKGGEHKASSRSSVDTDTSVAIRGSENGAINRDDPCRDEKESGGKLTRIMECSARFTSFARGGSRPPISDRSASPVNDSISGKHRPNVNQTPPKPRNDSARAKALKTSLEDEKASMIESSRTMIDKNGENAIIEAKQVDHLENLIRIETDKNFVPPTKKATTTENNRRQYEINEANSFQRVIDNVQHSFETAPSVDSKTNVYSSTILSPSHRSRKDELPSSRDFFAKNSSLWNPLETSNRQNDENLVRDPENKSSVDATATSKFDNTSGKSNEFLARNVETIFSTIGGKVDEKIDSTKSMDAALFTSTYTTIAIESETRTMRKGDSSKVRDSRGGIAEVIVPLCAEEMVSGNGCVDLLVEDEKYVEVLAQSHYDVNRAGEKQTRDKMQNFRRGSKEKTEEDTSVQATEIRTKSFTKQEEQLNDVHPYRYVAQEIPTNRRSYSRETNPEQEGDTMDNIYKLTVNKSEACPEEKRPLEKKSGEIDERPESEIASSRSTDQSQISADTRIRGDNRGEVGLARARVRNIAIESSDASSFGISDDDRSSGISPSKLHRITETYPEIVRKNQTNFSVGASADVGNIAEPSNDPLSLTDVAIALAGSSNAIDTKVPAVDNPRVAGASSFPATKHETARTESADIAMRLSKLSRKSEGDLSQPQTNGVNQATTPFRRYEEALSYKTIPVKEASTHNFTPRLVDRYILSKSKRIVKDTGFESSSSTTAGVSGLTETYTTAKTSDSSTTSHRTFTDLELSSRTPTDSEQIGPPDTNLTSFSATTLKSTSGLVSSQMQPEFPNKKLSSFVTVIPNTTTTTTIPDVDEKAMEINARSLVNSNATMDLDDTSNRTPTTSNLWPVKHSAVIEGDLVLGGLMMVHEREDSVICGPVMPQGGVQALEAMLYTLDRLNNQQIIPGVKIGAHILDDCDKDTYGLEMAVDFIKGT